MKRLALLASLAAFATPAAAQPALFPPQNMTSTNLGLFTDHDGTDARGGHWSGTSARLGQFTETDFTGPNGQHVHCTSSQLGQFTETDCR
jgi:hypothetical protein